ncbi:unnamed protein product [Prunus armeniaca]
MSKQPATVVQHDQELLETPDNGLDNFSPTIVSSPIIQSGHEDFPKITEHLNSNLSILPESSHTGNTSYQLPIRTIREIPRQQYDPDLKTKVKYPIANHVPLHRLSSSCASFVCQLSIVSISSNVREALKDPKWTQAMNDEMEALQKNSTWEMTILNKWKRTLERSVAKGYTQTYGIDYEETLALIAKINTIWSPRAWFGKFSKSMKDFGYKQITGNDPVEKAALQHHLASEFEMKDLGALKYFLSIEVARLEQGIFLSQWKYILDILTDTGMLASKPVDTQMELNHQLGEYPDQFMHAPSEAHMDAVNRILRYLKSSPGRGLMFARHGHIDVEGHTDANWAGSVTDRRSTSGYFTFVEGNLVSW